MAKLTKKQWEILKRYVNYEASAGFHEGVVEFAKELRGDIMAMMKSGTTRISAISIVERMDTEIELNQKRVDEYREKIQEEESLSG